MKRVYIILAAFLAAAALAIPATAHGKHHGRFWTPGVGIKAALCVHDGWHYRRAWTIADKRHAQYAFGNRRYIRTDKTWSNGEGAWNVVDEPYGGGMQFMLSTWHRAGGSGYSVSAIAAASPREQIYRAWRIVRGDGGSWREWPNTGRACGLPQ